MNDHPLSRWWLFFDGFLLFSVLDARHSSKGVFSSRGSRSFAIGLCIYGMRKGYYFLVVLPGTYVGLLLEWGKG